MNRKIEYPDEADEQFLKFRRIEQQRKEGREESARHYDDRSRERLRKIIETKIRTTMIGALSVVEQKFGCLWGQGKPRHQLDERELEMEALKEELRTEILNLGNCQLRAATAEINQYDVTWNRYRYDLLADPDKIFGLDVDGTPKRPRHGTNPDGSIKTSPDGPEGRE